MRKKRDELDKIEKKWKKRGLFLQRRRWPGRLLQALVVIALTLATAGLVMPSLFDKLL